MEKKHVSYENEKDIFNFVACPCADIRSLANWRGIMFRCFPFRKDPENLFLFQPNGFWKRQFWSFDHRRFILYPADLSCFGARHTTARFCSSSF